ncbi:MAG: hypothetical protein MZV63_27080 [Marinilabiliales bacterium]|nr:hypothetical protein [Marinilabiliales bacterium]
MSASPRTRTPLDVGLRPDPPPPARAPPLGDEQARPVADGMSLGEGGRHVDHERCRRAGVPTIGKLAISGAGLRRARAPPRSGGTLTSSRRGTGHARRQRRRRRLAGWAPRAAL